jgi:hypothetical protein
MSKRTKEARAAKRQRQVEEFTKTNGVRAMFCPQCGKPRMRRPHGHEINLEKQKYTTRSGDEVELLTDICVSCEQRNYRLYFQPTKTEAKKVLQAMKAAAEGESVDGPSLEEML